MKSLSVVAVSILLLLQSVACAAEAMKPGFRWVGCGITKKAFMNSLAKAYEQKTGIRINLEGGGATKGIRSVADMKADMGGACRYVLEGNEQEEQVKMVPMAWDALVVITHKSNTVDSISVRDLESVYRGQIDNWKTLGGQSSPIRLFARDGKISGVGRTLRELVLGDTEIDFDATSRFFPSSGPLEAAVEKEKDAIAVTGISSARKRDVKILRLNGREPSYENIKNGNYLLYRPLYLVVNTAHDDYIEMKRFSEFANSPEGRNVVRNNGVVPYLEAPSLLLKQMEQWRTSGS